jgi:hypothetical protein
LNYKKQKKYLKVWKKLYFNSGLTILLSPPIENTWWRNA